MYVKIQTKSLKLTTEQQTKPIHLIFLRISCEFDHISTPASDATATVCVYVSAFAAHMLDITAVTCGASHHILLCVCVCITWTMCSLWCTHLLDSESQLVHSFTHTEAYDSNDWTQGKSIGVRATDKRFAKGLPNLVG